MNEKAKQQLKDWRTLVDELNVQFHLGTAEAKDEFEKQKKILLKWLDSMSDKLHDAQDFSKEKAAKLKPMLEELRVQVALGTAETKEELEEQQLKITKSIQKIKKNLSEAYEHSKEGLEEFAENMDDKLSEFHTRFDLFRLHFHLGKEETKEFRDEKMKTISNKLHVIKSKLVKAGEKLEDKWEDFSDDIVEEWHHLRNLN